MADENADRIHVPGADGSTPARDVEPFWPDEPETPVHGRAVPLTDRMPPIGMVQVEPGVFRPAGGPQLPPGVHVPGQRAPSSNADARSGPQPVPQTRPVSDPQPVPPTAPLSAPQPVPPTAPVPGLQPIPRGGSPFAPSGQPEGHTTAESPWALPLHRPAPVWAQPAVPVRPHTATDRPVSPPAGEQPPAAPYPGSPRPVHQESAATFTQSVDQQPTATSTRPVDQQSTATSTNPPAGQHPVARPVSTRLPADLGSSGHTTAVPSAQPAPQPSHAAPGTPPNAGIAPTDLPRGVAETRPSAHAAASEGTTRTSSAWTDTLATPPRSTPSTAPARPGPYTTPPGTTAPARPTTHTTPPATTPNTASGWPAEPDGAPEPGRGSTGEADPFQELNWMVDGTPTAEEFARRRLARPARQSATMGARAALQKGMFGLVKLAPGQRELEYRQDVEMVRRNFGGLRQVTVVNPKGGAGKTVAVLLLAMTFGQKRGGYVLAWDNNETQGTLGMRAQQDFHARTVRDMMRDLHLFQGAQGRVGDLSQYVRAQGEGMFDVLASDESATAGEMLTAASFAEIRDVVSRFYKLIFVDTGNNVRAENWQAAMDATDQLVITMSARNDSAETAARALDHLEQSGRRRLVRQAVTIVTMPPTRKDIDLQWIEQHFAARTRAVLVAPYERLIDSGEPIRYGELSGNTKDAWLKIAAAVADGL